MARFLPFWTKLLHPKLGLKDDICLYLATKEALLAVGEWLKDTFGGTFEAVVTTGYCSWAGSVPEEITASVSKTDMEFEGIKIHVLKASSVKETLPVVVYLHGGGFAAWSCMGGAYDPYLTRLAALGECIIVAVDFVSTLDQPFPAGLDECQKAIKWVVAGGTPGVPRGKVTIAGDLAGGSLAMGVTLRVKQEGWVSDIDGVCNLCPFLDGIIKDERYPSLEEFDSYFLNEGSLSQCSLTFASIRLKRSVSKTCSSLP
jgi:acetyl esterase/lipase